MSVPPQLIRVKRKATEEAPVSYLRVQDTKRHRSKVFVYKRQDEDATFASIPSPIQKPIIHISQPTAQDTTFQAPNGKHTRDGEIKDVEDVPANDLPASHHAATDADADVVGHVEQRRFHLSRVDAMLSESPYPTRSHGGVTKKRSAPALFVERRIKRISSRTVEKLQAAADAEHSEHSATLAGQDAPATQNITLPTTPDVGAGTVPRKYKRPGVSKLTGKASAPNAKTELPQSMTKPSNIDMDRMAEEMNAFVLEQIGLNLQKAEEEEQQRNKSRKGGLSSSQLKFKPKAPAKRYSERHPETAPEPADKDMADVADIGVGVSDTDDDDYIIETYVRVPASKMGDNVPPQSVGLLVFDEEPDIEYFYGEGSDSEEEWAEDEEDENAENYYTADYPDDEVASDDEYDMNAYAYRTGNASDLEEYGTDDDYDDNITYESNDAKSGFKTFINRNGVTTNHL